MQDLIRSVDLKLARADFQIRSLTDQISSWISSNPTTARCELSEGRLGFRLIVQDFAENAPIDHWGLLIGECVHNLRSAIDNLAFALSRLRHDPPSKPSAIAFPIYQDRSMFEKSGRAKLDQMPDTARELIELVQPFQRDGSEEMSTPDRDALILLQWLSNADKHRVPSVVLIAPTEMSHSGKVTFYSEEDAKANVPPDTPVWLGPLQPGVVLMEYKTNRPIKSVRGDYSVIAVVSVETIHQTAPVVEVLRALSHYTALVVAQFRGFFK